MRTEQIRKIYLDFFTDKIRKHQQILAAPLVPLNDVTTLFTSSGMQQLIPYLKGKLHPLGKRLTNSQPCFRAEDIEQIGDNHHLTFFEMLGNWSLAGYSKENQLQWFWQFLTKKLKLSENRLHVTVFKGDKNSALAPDTESRSIWMKLGVPESHIHWYGPEKNWWSRAGDPNHMPSGEIGGADSEIFYDFGDNLKIHEKSPFKNEKCHVNCDCGRFLEIGNSVFIQYEKQKNGSFKPLLQKNIDFGGGLERLAAASQNNPDIFQIDIIWPIIKEIERISNQKYQNNNQAPMRVIADHLRAAVFMIAAGVEPSNKKQGYILRRLLRRSAVKMYQLREGLTPVFDSICYQVIEEYKEYFNSPKIRFTVKQILKQEMDKFTVCLNKGLKKVKKFNPKDDPDLFAFNLYQTEGFPVEITRELIKDKNIKINMKKFKQILEKHKELSRTASIGMFKSGLENQSAVTRKLHTATHLLHQSLRTILGSHIRQEGSNITEERLRFDFIHPRALTKKEIVKIEKMINQKIKEDLPVKKTIEDKKEALRSGAVAFFKEVYPDKVSVYTIADFSKEVCAGPHVASTGQIQGVKIIKEQSCGAGKRRIYAVLIK